MGQVHADGYVVLLMFFGCLTLGALKKRKKNYASLDPFIYITILSKRNLIVVILLITVYIIG